MRVIILVQSFYFFFFFFSRIRDKHKQSRSSCRVVRSRFFSRTRTNYSRLLGLFARPTVYVEAAVRWNDFHKAFVDSRRRVRDAHVRPIFAKSVQKRVSTCKHHPGRVCNPFQPLHGVATVVIFNSLFRSLYWRLFDWLQTRVPFQGAEGKGEMEMMRLDWKDSVLSAFTDFIPIFPIRRYLERHLIEKKSLVFPFLMIDHLCCNYALLKIDLDWIFKFVLFGYLKISIFFLSSW